MICAAIEDFAAALPRAGAIAGLDLGTKTIGVAVSDGLRGVASPLTQASWPAPQNGDSGLPL